MIYVGIDDTDTAETRGTNQLARLIVQAIVNEFRCIRIARHQLMVDPRIPFTSKNGSASIVLEARKHEDLNDLASQIEAVMREHFVPGSDPGLCVTDRLVPQLGDFGRRCQRKIVCQGDSRKVAATHNVLLRGLGGTEDGVIGALAAVGLAMGGDDGRVVQRGETTEEISGHQSIGSLKEQGVAVRTYAGNQPVTTGVVDVGKKLRPNLRNNQFVLFVKPAATEDSGVVRWVAMKLP